MPFNSARMKSLREIKGFSQEELAGRAGLSQSAVNKAETGTSSPTADVLEKIASALDCTMDYLHSRGPNYDDDRAAAAKMSFDVFASDKSTNDQDRERCHRASTHRDAPKTARLWRSFAEMVEMAVGTPPASTKLVVLKKGRSRTGTR